MHSQKHELKQTLRIRYWQAGQIAVSAKTRIESLIQSGQHSHATAMASEWIISAKK